MPIQQQKVLQAKVMWNVPCTSVHKECTVYSVFHRVFDRKRLAQEYIFKIEALVFEHEWAFRQTKNNFGTVTFDNLVRKI